MACRLTIRAEDMREINRSAIREIIRRESPIARSAIADRLDVSLPTMMRIVDEFIEEGYVRPHGSTEWRGDRRHPLLEFNVENFVVISVDLVGTKLYEAIPDLGGLTRQSKIRRLSCAWDRRRSTGITLHQHG